MIRIPRRRCVRLLAGAAILLALLSYWTQAHRLRQDLAADRYALLDLNQEANLPSWYSSFLLLAGAVAVAAVALAKRRAQDPHASRWALLSVLFVYLSLDEAAELHERSGRFVEAVSAPTGLLYYPWVIPGAIAVLAVALFFRRFAAHLPRPTLARLLLAGAVYVGGALGLELASGLTAAATGHGSFGFLALATIEELSEMAGAILFLNAILAYAASESIALDIGFGD